VTWILGPSFGWSNLEPSVAIISACLPTYAPLFRSLRNKGNSGENGGSSAYLGRKGTPHHGSHVGAHSQTPSFLRGQPHFRIQDDDDDEVELTHQFRAEGHHHHKEIGTSASVNSASEHSDTITVKTQIQVVSSERF
jgi:hypothetical protein